MCRAPIFQGDISNLPINITLQNIISKHKIKMSAYMKEIQDKQGIGEE
jgi:hypothetical protein